MVGNNHIPVTFAGTTVGPAQQSSSVIGRHVRLIALCVASRWESAPPGKYKKQKKLADMCLVHQARKYGAYA
jgi:hypothetical protein